MDSNQTTKRVKKALEPLLGKASLCGWCWGRKNRDNPYSASNFVLAVGEEMVSVSQRNGELVIHEFRKKKTNLGKRVREILQREGLIPKEGEKEVFSMTGTEYTWSCSFCGHRGKVDADGVEDQQLLINRIYQAHASKAVPGCDWCKNVRIFDPQMRECFELQRLVALQKVS